MPNSKERQPQKKTPIKKTISVIAIFTLVVAISQSKPRIRFSFERACKMAGLVVGKVCPGVKNRTGAFIGLFVCIVSIMTSKNII